MYCNIIKKENKDSEFKIIDSAKNYKETKRKLKALRKKSNSDNPDTGKNTAPREYPKYRIRLNEEAKS